MTARVEHHERVQVVPGPHSAPLPITMTQGYTAWCDDERCGEWADEEGTLVSLWRGRTHLVGFESAPNAEAIIDAELHNESRHASDSVRPNSGDDS